MRVAYVDTSCLVAIAFGEAGGAAMAQKLARFEELFSSNLLEAELRASFVREHVEMDKAYLAQVTWVLPDRPLSAEIVRVLAAAHLRGADLWHVACALYLAGDPTRVSFLTLDARQAEVAGAIGFTS